MADDELIENILRNMRPGLQIALANKRFQNIDNLFSHCVGLETIWRRHGYMPELPMMPRRFVNEISQGNLYNVPI